MVCGVGVEYRVGGWVLAGCLTLTSPAINYLPIHLPEPLCDFASFLFPLFVKTAIALFAGGGTGEGELPEGSKSSPVVKWKRQGVMAGTAAFHRWLFWSSGSSAIA